MDFRERTSFWSLCLGAVTLYKVPEERTIESLWENIVPSVSQYVVVCDELCYFPFPISISSAWTTCIGKEIPWTVLSRDGIFMGSIDADS